MSQNNASESMSFLDRHYFLIRRLHSASGIVPIGVFLLPHLTTNSSVVWGNMLNTAHTEGGHAGVETFQHEVNFIHDLPALILIEWGVLFLPILFHAIVGIWFASSARPNVDRYSTPRNWRYTLQRISGYLGVIFIFMHITSLRFGWTYGNLLPAFIPEHAASSTANHFQNGSLGLLIPVFYLACVLGLVFHFANGLWTAGITWGLTVSAASQKRWGWCCAVIGVGLGTATIAAVVGFTTLDVDAAIETENQLLMHVDQDAAEVHG